MRDLAWLLRPIGLACSGAAAMNALGPVPDFVGFLIALFGFLCIFFTRAGDA